MAETLTVDTTPQTETLGENLTADEQDSLALGEKMVAQQEQLLAGKYKNAEELEKAYVELQSKLGKNEKEDNTEAEKEEVLPEESEEDSKEYSEGAQLIKDASTEYFDNDRSLKPETLEKFASMSSQDLVNAYMELNKNVQQTESTEPVEVSQQDINVVQNSVGGEAEYGKIIDWAGKNLNQESIDAFDSVVETGNVQMIKLAIAGVKAQYEAENGSEGRMLTGKPPKSSSDTFRSQAELVRAMSDPKYDNDPAYRQDIIDKLDRSDLSF